MPADARGDDQEAAAKFVEHYVDLLNYSAASGDTDALRSLDDGDCLSCREVLSTIDEVKADGGRIEGGSWTPRVLDTLPSGDGWVVDVEVEFAPQEIVRGDGQPAEKFEGGDGLLSFIVKPRDDAWVLDEWTRAS